MASFISTLIRSALFVSLASFMFWYFFPEMFESSLFHMFDYSFPKLFGYPFSMFERVLGQQSRLDAMGGFISRLISSTIIASMFVYFLTRMLESFLDNMFDYIFPKFFDNFFCWIAEKANYFRSLEDNLKALDDAMDGLLFLKENVIREVNAAEENPNMRRKKEVTSWLENVKAVETKVLVLNGEIEKLHLGGFFSKNFNSRYEFGRKVANLKEEMTKLKVGGGNFKDDVAERAPAASATRLPTEPIIASKGQQLTLNKFWKCLRGEKEVGIIGLYGPGGVGKTTLLKQINNKFCEDSNGFQVVIWVVMSNKPSVEKLQEQIGTKLGFSDDESWKKRSPVEKSQDISNVLYKKKFALLLDDIWEEIDLTEVGVPLQSLQSTGSKIVFTTRKHDVCDSMRSKKFAVKCLADEEAWELFQMTVGKDTLRDFSILAQARIMYKECDGLPLALVVIGRAMSSKKTRQEWELAIQDLKTLSSEFSGMEDKVYVRLKFSYDNLSKDTIRSCFLYCSLFPEDYKISKTNLLDYWVGEGFVDVYNRGFSIIGELVRACLLEEEEGEFDDYVKILDVMRDMALWIAKEEKENFLVEVGVGLTQSPDVENLKGIKRLSLMNNEIESLTAFPNCPDLLTLFLNDNDLREITDDFFKSMSSLKVLDLSLNFDLKKLPLGISNLVSLQHLDLSDTGICELPEALSVMVNLKCLKAENTYHLNAIPKKLISKFEKLLVLRLVGCDPFNNASEDSVLFGGGELLVKELFGLKQLSALSLTLNSADALEIFLRYNNLMSCAQSLQLAHFKESATLNISFLKDMKNLHALYIRWCPSLKFMEIDFAHKITIGTDGFHSIQTIVIDECHNLRDLTWLTLAPNLKKIQISNCNSMKEIISVQILSHIQTMAGNLNPFEKLQFLQLGLMRHLQSIYLNALPFPYLKELRVFDCPKLKKLPLDSNSAKNHQITIYGKEQWWKQLQWEDEATKNVFLPCFKG